VEAAWIAVIGTLGGVLITALTGITTAMLTARFQARASVRQIQVETVRLLRAEKRDIFVQYLEA
jgi:hypothetical protein